ncbi:uncharacterized protein FIBRA_08310 [Fibroporia radiculosa]|uniref:Uncharacterized protein n=1 Tax=Fibroporia radiculosa TaxID=599839 RepID=J4GH28_9APHY|nr:uncharacterized protein FIBRA_08310 [Fibroporia radiculosa]CCM06063.1 predicted protein [Fibroporia radiculosa]
MRTGGSQDITSEVEPTSPTLFWRPTLDSVADAAFVTDTKDPMSNNESNYTFLGNMGCTYAPTPMPSSMEVNMMDEGVGYDDRNGPTLQSDSDLGWALTPGPAIDDQDSIGPLLSGLSSAAPYNWDSGCGIYFNRGRSPPRSETVASVSMFDLADGWNPQTPLWEERDQSTSGLDTAPDVLGNWPTHEDQSASFQRW